jgi:hypothetical protein
MPHKRNPVLAERVSGLARLLRADALVALENMALWHERDISHSSAERFIFERALGVAAYATRTLTVVLDGLTVDAERMRTNLEALGGAIFSEAVLLALIESGLDRQSAYRLVQRAAMSANAGPRTFREELLADPVVQRRLQPAALDSLFDPQHAVAHVSDTYGGRAASIVAAEPELWVAGALAELVSLGWLPLVAAVVPLPSPADAGFLVAGVIGRRELPLLIAALVATTVGALLLITLLRALGDGVTFRGVALRSLAAEARGTRVGLLWAVELAAVVPMAAALAILAGTAIAVGPREWQSPDIGGLTLIPRLLLALAPALALVLAATLLGEMLRSALIRRLVSGDDRAASIGRGAIRDLVAHARPAAALAVVALVARASFLVVSFVLLRALWRPLGGEAESGTLLALPGPPLLLGFVFVWLCLTLGSGGLRAWLAGWWTAELTDGMPLRDRREERRPAWTRGPSSS